MVESGKRLRTTRWITWTHEACSLGHIGLQLQLVAVLDALSLEVIAHRRARRVRRRAYGQHLHSR